MGRPKLGHATAVQTGVQERDRGGASPVSSAGSRTASRNYVTDDGTVRGHTIRQGVQAVGRRMTRSGFAALLVVTLIALPAGTVLGETNASDVTDEVQRQGFFVERGTSVNA